MSNVLNFVKMHGAGNDYVYVDAAAEGLVDADDPTLVDLATRISNRQFGVGGDGLILVLPDDDADVRMRMFNIDGSEGTMCGNGVRCVAKFAVDRRLVSPDAETIRVATLGGTRHIGIVRQAGHVVGASVDMGQPTIGNTDQHLADLDLTAVLVATGNPHAVVFVDDLSAVDLPRVGPRVSSHSDFPGELNAHFAQVVDRGHVKVAHWERGSGPTLACGTGACATCVAGVVTGRLDRDVLVDVPGGQLRIQWDEATNHMHMTGPAVTVFEGSWHHRESI